MNLLLASSPVKNNTIKPLGPETDPALGSKLSHYSLMCSAEPVNKLPASPGQSRKDLWIIISQNNWGFFLIYVFYQSCLCV